MRNQISDLLFRTVFIAIIGVWALLGFTLFFGNSQLAHEVAEQGGEWSLRIFWVITLPGILNRFKVVGFLQDVQIVLVRSRRRLGILMFSLGILHATFERTVFLIQQRIVPTLSSFSRFELMGILALTLLTPLFITSNNWSVRILKKNWKRVHVLIYPALWFISLHMLWQGLLLNAYVTMFFGIMQIASWGNYWFNPQRFLTNTSEKKQPSSASQA